MKAQFRFTVTGEVEGLDASQIKIRLDSFSDSLTNSHGRNIKLHDLSGGFVLLDEPEKKEPIEPAERTVQKVQTLDEGVDSF